MKRRTGDQVSLYEKRIARLKKKLDAQETLRAEQRTHYGDVLAKYMTELRGARNQIESLTTSALQDHFKINEYENQQAVYLKQNAELSQDLQKVTKRYNENVVSTNKMLDTIVQLKDDIRFLQEDLANARKTLRYRIYIWASGFPDVMRARLHVLKQRIKIRWTISRLSKRRVDALYEAGHIPEKLVKSALAYYEHDRQRMEIDEQIRVIHGGSDWATYVRAEKPSLWRRWNIFLGRA
jgi:DNA repair exonuclease SbcCD ATPase subunit